MSGEYEYGAYETTTYTTEYYDEYVIVSSDGVEVVVSQSIYNKAKEGDIVVVKYGKKYIDGEYSYTEKVGFAGLKERY